MNARGRTRRMGAACAAIMLTAAVSACTPQSVIDVLSGCTGAPASTAGTPEDGRQVTVATAPAGALGTIEAATNGDVTENMDTTQTMNRYNNGTDVPCDSYPDGQCTWWACMRGRRLGMDVGRYWGNGGDWAASAAGLGYEVTTSNPVSGAIVSFPPGVQGADATYGHVAVVEKVDPSAGILLISEMNVKGFIATSRTLPIESGAKYILPKKGEGKHAGATQPSAGTAKETQPVKTEATSVRGNWECGASDADTATGAAHTVAIEYAGDGRHATPDEAKAIARRLIIERYKEWDPDSEFDALIWVWEHESGWRWNAENPTSGAYGIPQSLPGDKMAAAGDDWRDNAATQIAWGLSYIKQRYQSPTGAKAFWLKNNWY